MLSNILIRTRVGSLTDQTTKIPQFTLLLGQSGDGKSEAISFSSRLLKDLQRIRSSVIVEEDKTLEELWVQTDPANRRLLSDDDKKSNVELAKSAVTGFPTAAGLRQRASQAQTPIIVSPEFSKLLEAMTFESELVSLLCSMWSQESEARDLKLMSESSQMDKPSVGILAVVQTKIFLKFIEEQPAKLLDSGLLARFNVLYLPRKPLLEEPLVLPMPIAPAVQEDEMSQETIVITSSREMQFSAPLELALTVTDSGGNNENPDSSRPVRSENQIDEMTSVGSIAHIFLVASMIDDHLDILGRKEGEDGLTLDLTEAARARMISFEKTFVNPLRNVLDKHGQAITTEDGIALGSIRYVSKYFTQSPHPNSFHSLDAITGCAF